MGDVSLFLNLRGSPYLRPEFTFFKVFFLFFNISSLSKTGRKEDCPGRKKKGMYVTRVSKLEATHMYHTKALVK